MYCKHLLWLLVATQLLTNMSKVLQELVLDLKNNTGSDLSKKVPDDGVIKVWEKVSTFISDNMCHEKGVCIPGLGTFAFSQKKLDVGNNQYLLVQRPIFQLLEKFAQTHGLTHCRQHITGQFPIMPLNYSTLSIQTGYDRDVVERCIHEVLLVFARSLHAKKNVEFLFSGIGRLQIRHSKVKMKFFKSFINAIDNSGGKLAPAMQGRPGTADSVMSERPMSVRPHTSNTCILPRDMGASEGQPRYGSAANLPSIQEEGNFNAFGENNNNTTFYDNGAIVSNYCLDNDYQPAAVPATPLINNYTTDRVNGYAENNNYASDDNGLNNGGVLASAYPTVSFDATATKSPVGESYGLGLTEDARPATTTLAPPMSAPNVGRSYSADLLPQPPVAPQPTTLTCTHSNSGQELCYLCHQRNKANNYVSFAAEQAAAENLEGNYLHQYQQLREAEFLLKQQEEFKKKFHENQKTAAYNQGIAEANKMRKSMVNPEDSKPSYIMNHRALTPPKYVKQEKYFADLSDQVKKREEAEKRKKADETFLEHLERVQVEEDIVAQKERDAINKAVERDSYQKALATQVKQKALRPPSPALSATEPYFGRNDINSEKLAEKRRLAMELYKEQLAVVEQQKRDMILKKVQEQQSEQNALYNAKRDMLDERSSQFVRRLRSRKQLEQDWMRAAADKRQRGKRGVGLRPSSWYSLAGPVRGTTLSPVQAIARKLR
jgi:nucleoid DNA-binding protein